MRVRKHPSQDAIHGAETPIVVFAKFGKTFVHHAVTKWQVRQQFELPTEE